MRGATVTLPAAAADKITNLTLQKDSALDQQRGCANRMGMLPQDAEALRERLNSEVARHAERFRSLSLTVSKLNQFVFELKLPPNTVLEMAPPPEIKIRTTPAAAIESTRAQIADLHREIALVRAAPMKKASMQAAIQDYLSSLALRAKPRVGFDRQAGPEWRLPKRWWSASPISWRWLYGAWGRSGCSLLSAVIWN
jgi:hypothetical protein